MSLTSLHLHSHCHQGSSGPAALSNKDDPTNRLPGLPHSCLQNPSRHNLVPTTLLSSSLTTRLKIALKKTFYNRVPSELSQDYPPTCSTASIKQTTNKTFPDATPLFPLLCMREFLCIMILKTQVQSHLLRDAVLGWPARCFLLHWIPAGLGLSFQVLGHCPLRVGTGMARLLLAFESCVSFVALASNHLKGKTHSIVVECN